MKTGGGGRTANFRTNFIGRIVGDAAEGSRFQLEEQILAEHADVDLAKLFQFVVKHQVPHAHRVAIWRLLLKVVPCYAEARANVAVHRAEEARLLLNSLIVMRLTTRVYELGADDKQLDLNKVDIVRMIQLGEGRLATLKDKFPTDLKAQSQYAIAEHMLTLCESEWIDAYWLTKMFDERLASIFTDDALRTTADEIIGHLQVMFANVSQKYSTSATWSRLPLRFWIRSAAAPLFNNEPLYRLWDKVCSCSDESVITLINTVILGYLAEAGDRIISDIAAKGRFTLDFHLTPDRENFVISRCVGSMSQWGRFGSRKSE